MKTQNTHNQKGKNNACDVVGKLGNSDTLDAEYVYREEQQKNVFFENEKRRAEQNKQDNEAISDFDNSRPFYPQNRNSSQNLQKKDKKVLVEQ